MRITGMHSVLCHAARGRYVVTDSGCTTVPDTASESHGLVPCVVAVAGAYSASRRVCFRLVRWLASSRVGGIGSAARRLKRGGKRAEQQCGGGGEQWRRCVCPDTLQSERVAELDRLEEVTAHGDVHHRRVCWRQHLQRSTGG